MSALKEAEAPFVKREVLWVPSNLSIPKCHKCISDGALEDIRWNEITAHHLMGKFSSPSGFQATSRQEVLSKTSVSLIMTSPPPKHWLIWAQGLRGTIGSTKRKDILLHFFAVVHCYLW